jgi:uncharacterized protein DUF4054
MNNAAFRAAFTEFNDLSVYPDESLTFWSAIAVLQVNANRWKNMTSNGIMLYVAHNLVLNAQNLKTSAAGGAPGGMSGPTAGKTVGSVSVTYDTQAAVEKDAGFWNLTTYGKQFYRLSRMFGTGVIQV